jgi:hypothetical protein
MRKWRYVALPVLLLAPVYSIHIYSAWLTQWNQRAAIRLRS